MPDPGDARYYARLRALEAVLPRFPEQTTEAVLLPLPRLAGIPGERGLRHLVARNHGATHVLLLDEDEDAPAEDLAALDHALGIEAVPGGRPVHLPDRGRWCLPDEVPAGETARDADAGTLVERLQRGERIPEWLGWPEQCAHLARAWPPRVKQGFTLFLTGLSGSGKSTIARALLGRLMEEGSRRVTLLDGDIVRKNLSSELGFSREHRNLNILRIGFVASEITKNGGVAICAPIAPYAATRHAVREAVEAVGGFVEVHVATPLEVCEARDRKGLYARARAGLIKEFTGISDPYEEPVGPELRIDTTEMSPDEAAQQVLLRLAALGYLA
jgi:sulfate adenylyltransferase